MTKTKQDKYLNQIRELFLLDENESQQRLDGLNQFIEEAKAEDAPKEMIDALLNDKVNMEKLVQFDNEHPLPEFILNHLQSNLDDREITKVLNFLYSDLYKKFTSCVGEAFTLNSDMLGNLIDVGVDQFLDQNKPKLH